jgi:TRAP-type mannitol/chloroaromatic compound transport system permease small subunit
MPNLTFVLPHWLYWLGLILVPLAAIYILHKTRGRPVSDTVTLPIAYFLLVTAGFIGMHRFYLRNMKGVLFIPLFIAILFSNHQGQQVRNEVSLAKNEVTSVEFMLERATRDIENNGDTTKQERDRLQSELDSVKADLSSAIRSHERWDLFATIFSLMILVMLIVDVILLPRILARNKLFLDEERLHEKTVEVPCDVDVDGMRSSEYLSGIHTPFVDFTNRLNDFVGRFVAYWSILAVIVYYYEVLARYVFNSPTNWAHESMFLMFGMQYLLAGGYVLRYNGHVRVDVIYIHFSERTKAIIDIFTSVFFFIFVLTLLWTGWTFFYDSFSIGEVSFTEWAIQYWPVKMAIPVGAALLLLQGLAWLTEDIAVAFRRRGT